MPGPAEFLKIVELLAVVSSAIYGILLGCRKHFDVVGIFSVSFVLAFGGGTLRDVMLGRHPLFWIAHDRYVAIVLGLSIVGALAPKLISRFERFLPIPDALGLALFSITGAGFALEQGCSLLVASVMAAVTGTFGGVMAEVICNEIPSLFRSAPLYATCSFGGSWVYLLMKSSGMDPGLAIIAGFAAIFLSRLAALKWNIRLPNASLER